MRILTIIEKYKKILKDLKGLAKNMNRYNSKTESNYRRKASISVLPELAFESIIDKCNKKRINLFQEALNCDNDDVKKMKKQERINSYYIDIMMLAVINSYYGIFLPNRKIDLIKTAIENKYEFDVPLGFNFNDLYDNDKTLEIFKKELCKKEINNNFYFIDAYTIGLIITKRLLKNQPKSNSYEIVEKMTQHFLEANTLYEITKTKLINKEKIIK